MDVDWSKTAKGKEAYREQCVTDFKDMGVSHVRIRIKDPADEALFRYLDAQIDDCLAHQLIPVIARRMSLKTPLPRRTSTRRPRGGGPWPSGTGINLPCSPLTF